MRRQRNQTTTYDFKGTCKLGCQKFIGLIFYPFDVL